MSLTMANMPLPFLIRARAGKEPARVRFCVIKPAGNNQNDPTGRRGGRQSRRGARLEPTAEPTRSIAVGGRRAWAEHEASIHRSNNHSLTPQHFLYFLPLPHEQGSLRPGLGAARRIVATCPSAPLAFTSA